jgi:hypothetical protein
LDDILVYILFGSGFFVGFSIKETKIYLDHTPCIVHRHALTKTECHQQTRGHAACAGYSDKAVRNKEAPPDFVIDQCKRLVTIAIVERLCFERTGTNSWIA